MSYTPTVYQNYPDKTTPIDAAHLNKNENELARVSVLSDNLSPRVAEAENRINQIVAPTGTAPNPAEITDARVGSTGVTYDSLGNAVRSQFNEELSRTSNITKLALSNELYTSILANAKNGGAGVIAYDANSSIYYICTVGIDSISIKMGTASGFYSAYNIQPAIDVAEINGRTLLSAGQTKALDVSNYNWLGVSSNAAVTFSLNDNNVLTMSKAYTDAGVKENKEYIDNQLSENVTFNDKSKLYKDYYAIVTEPSGIDQTNTLIQIKVFFEHGECKSPSCIKVFNSTGNEVGAQFEGVRQQNLLLDNDATYYADGTLRAGTLWIVGSIAKNAKNKYIIRVYNAPHNGYTSRVIYTKSNDEISVSANTHTFHFSDSKMLYAYDNDNSFKNDDRTSKGRIYATCTLKSCDIEGDGYIFRDIIYTWINADYEYKAVFRIFYDGSFKEESFMKITNSVATGVYQNYVQGWQLGSGSTIDSKNTDGYFTYSLTYNDNKWVASLIYDNGNIPRSDNHNVVPNFPAYYGSSDAAPAKLYAGWRNATDAFPLSPDLTFSCCYYFTPDADEYTYLKQFNPIVTFATCETIEALKCKIKAALVPHMSHISDYITNDLPLEYGGTRQWSKYYRYKYQGLITFSHAVSMFKAVADGYSLSDDAASFMNAWNNGWGFEYIGRFIPLAYEYYKESKTLSDDANANYFKGLCLACGEFCKNVFELYNDIPLSGGNPSSARNNSRCGALHCVAIAISLGSADLNSAYQGIAQVVINNSLMNTMLPEGNISTQRYTHYMAFALYDWMLANNLVKIKNTDHFSNYNNFVMDTTTPVGETKEQTYNPSTCRRGLEHTYAYYMGSLVVNGTYSDYACAYLLLKHLIGNDLPDGTVKFPMDEYPDKWLASETVDVIKLELGAEIMLLNKFF